MSLAIVVGSEGQDGRLLFDHLANEGALVIGIGRTSARCSDRKKVNPVRIGNSAEVQSLVAQTMPEEIYYVAARHHSSEDRDVDDPGWEFQLSYQVNLFGLVNFLEAVELMSPRTRVFYAGSCLVFGNPATSPQNEETPIAPDTIYGSSKAAGMFACRTFRLGHDVYAASGILYNHESPLRQAHFISSKIVRGAVGIAGGRQSRLVVGNLAATVDWGYAPDFVRAMTSIVRLPDPADFVVATGETHTVQDFVEIAFDMVGLDWRAHVVEQPGLVSGSRRQFLGDSSRLRNAAGWRPSVSFEEMIRLLILAEQEAATDV